MPLGKGAAPKSAVLSDLALKGRSRNYFWCHSTGFGNVGTSASALSKQTNKHPNVYEQVLRSWLEEGVSVASSHRRAIKLCRLVVPVPFA